MKQQTMEKILREIRQYSETAMYHDAMADSRCSTLNREGGSRHHDVVYREHHVQEQDARNTAELLSTILVIECCEDYEGSL